MKVLQALQVAVLMAIEGREGRGKGALDMEGWGPPTNPSQGDRISRSVKEETLHLIHCQAKGLRANL